MDYDELDRCIPKVGDTYDTVSTGRDIIARWLLDKGLSFRRKKSEKRECTLVCKKDDCSFYVRIYRGIQSTSLQKFELHNCSPDTHYDNPDRQSIWYIKEHHRSAVIDNRRVKASQIVSYELTQWGNTISSQQARRTKDKLLEEIDGKESETYAQIRDYIRRIQEVFSQVHFFDSN
jgi:hypothetical protein